MQVSQESAARTRLQAALAALPALAEAIGEDAAQREVRRELPFDRFALFRESGLGVLRFPAEWGWPRWFAGRSLSCDRHTGRA